MHRFNRKDAMGLVMILLPIAAIPLMILVMRPRPLSGETVLELSNAVCKQREDEILAQMLRRYEAVSLNMEGPDPENNPDFRWQQIQAEIEGLGVRPSEAGRIAGAARQSLGEAWPCLVQRGILKDRPVWVVAGSTPHSVDFIAWACSPSKEDIRQLNVQKYCTGSKAVIIDAQPPFRSFK